jgi:hypothetical protein
MFQGFFLFLTTNFCHIILLWRRVLPLLFVDQHCCSEPFVVQNLLLFRTFCCSEPFVIQNLLLLRTFCCSESFVVQNLLLFRTFCCSDPFVVQNLLILRMLFRTFAPAEAASPLAPWPPLFRRILDPLKR